MKIKALFLLITTIILFSACSKPSTTVEDSAEAKQYRQACDNGDTAACANLGNMYFQGRGVKQDNTKAVELFHRACQGKDKKNCGVLGLDVRYRSWHRAE